MNYSIYIHIPFCTHRCNYCDFNTYAGQEALIPAYLQALNSEIRIVLKEKQALPVHTIYFGGGTPSIIPVFYYQEILKLLNYLCVVEDNYEISIEANPGTLSFAYLEGLIDVGFNRLSIGIQSTNPFELSRLDRTHTVKDILNSIKFARQVGFENINFDLIFGIPGQNLTDWDHSLSRAIDLNPDHFSLYSLIVEPGTPLHRYYQRGKLPIQDQDLEGDMYELAMDKLAKNQYNHYEISNWARRDSTRDFRCKHNMQYWLNSPYFGFGAGAHGYINDIRYENAKSISEYIKRLSDPQFANVQFPSSPAACANTPVDLTTQMKDFMMLGFRLVEDGVSIMRFNETYPIKLETTFRNEIDKLLKLRLIEWGDDTKTNLRLTKRGIMVANQVFMEFV